MLKIIDKAAWQIDNGMKKDDVIKHFQTIFSWLGGKNFLSDEGKEILEIGVDSETSLNEKMLTPAGLTFLEQHYDEYLAKNGLNGDVRDLDKVFYSGSEYGMSDIHDVISTFIPSAGNKLPSLLIHHLEIVRDSLPFVNGNSNAQIHDATSIMTEFLAGTFTEMRKKELEGCEPGVAAKEATLTALKKLVSQYERAS